MNVCTGLALQVLPVLETHVWAGVTNAEKRLQAAVRQGLRQWPQLASWESRPWLAPNLPDDVRPDTSAQGSFIP